MPNELTNPNNVVTEERLAQFYQQILPYLGGMPDVLANKFNRADLYSTDEKLIGRWIDGKPLYQKTVTGQTGTKSTEVAFCTIPGIETMVSATGIIYRSDTRHDYIPAADVSILFSGNETISLYVGFEAGANRPCTLTIKYTKTTDSAVEIGSDTDYSTTEKIVGTWIDGKPIYQRTLKHAGMYLNASSWTTLFSDQAWAADVDRIISSEVSAIGDGGYPRTVDPMGIRINGTKIQYTADAYANGGPIYVTLRYTKTSS